MEKQDEPEKKNVDDDHSNNDATPEVADDHANDDAAAKVADDHGNDDAAAEVCADHLNGDTVAEVNDDASILDAEQIQRTEEVEKANGKDPTEEEPSEDLLAKIKAQVEYYFGNVNMQRDKFLTVQTKLDDGWIPMTVMLNFKLLAALTKNVDVILKALETSDLMEISDDRKKIRRSPKHPLPEFNEGYRKAQEARTIYAKGFPLDSTIENLKTFFEPYQPYETIVMRKFQDKDKSYHFKGSVFVQFETLDDAKAFMDLESVKYKDTELIRKWSTDYLTEKAQLKEERRKKKDKTTTSTIQEKETEEEEVEEISVENNKLPKGSIIYLSGVSKTCTREDIKESFSKFDANIAYIDFQRGNTEGWVRLQGANAAKPVLEKTNEGKMVIQDTEITCKILEGQEEAKYLAKVMEEMMSKSKNKLNKAKRGGKKGRGARAGKKRANSPSQDLVPNKKKCVENKIDS
ncbi:la protein homolog [Monomorium pharaonis]|uniref:la protein homolog n=1 Tax=Monomorium pharaonis TaxID=307658 RepID=UPI001747713B|nr:la protein homolog [Monomorium pharaonis]